jgi:hypothetical protein
MENLSITLIYIYLKITIGQCNSPTCSSILNNKELLILPKLIEKLLIEKLQIILLDKIMLK